MNLRNTLSLLLLPLAIAACDAQADVDYQGESLYSLNGSVNAVAATSGVDYEAVLVWFTDGPNGDTVSGQSVPVSAGFPSNFELQVFTPPSPEALGEANIAVALISALPAGTLLEDEESTGEPIAISEDFVLVYVAEDIEVGSPAEEFLGDALPSGYHLMEVVDVDDPSCPGEIFDCLRVAPGGMGTAIELNIMDAEDIEIPNFT